MQLNDSRLLEHRSYINGEWINGQNTFPVLNPFDLSLVQDVADLGATETEHAIAAAKDAFPAWSKRTTEDRSRILRKWHDLQIKHVDDLALILCTEQGKPMREAKGEIRYGAKFVEWFAEEAKRTYGDVIPPPSNNRRLVAIKQPVGVVAAITPWNFPNAMITRKVAPALAAGCTVVVKPAEDTPLSALALAKLAEEAGMPAGVLNVVTTSKPEDVGRVLTQSSDVRKLSFTGSTKVGKLLMAQCANTVKKVSLELGGNAPFIVFGDADIDLAVEGAMASKYRNAGQTCVCANRIFVHESIIESFTAKLVEASEKLKVGSGVDRETTVGPLINKAGLDKVQSLLDDAKEKGATVQTGGESLELDKGYFFSPTVMTNVNPEMDIFSDEIFGPIASIISFSSEEEVLEMANDTPYGLAAYFFGNDMSQIWRVAEALEYGMVGVNTGMISTPLAPFGGVKESGIGREGSKYGIEEYLEIKYLCFGGI